jgi:uracil-DNA glycosylase family 4
MTLSTTKTILRKRPARGDTTGTGRFVVSVDVDSEGVDSRGSEPGRECPLCPRLVEFRQSVRAAHPDWFNAPVPTFGGHNAQLLIVGLAPGMQGANRTGRPFTGDFAGDLLYATLKTFGFAQGNYQARPDDGFTLRNCRIVNAVRCLPPQNKPLPVEINTCRQFLIAAMTQMPNLRAIVVLGRVAHDSTLKALGLRAKDAPFGHGAVHQAGTIRLYDSYHCSRYNTNTRVLTPAMFEAVFAKVREDLEQS